MFEVLSAAEADRVTALYAPLADAVRELIDATIRKENGGGQAFYAGIGFVDYRIGAESISKRFAPS